MGLSPGPLEELSAARPAPKALSSRGDLKPLRFLAPTSLSFTSYRKLNN